MTEVLSNFVQIFHEVDNYVIMKPEYVFNSYIKPFVSANIHQQATNENGLTVTSPQFQNAPEIEVTWANICVFISSHVQEDDTTNSYPSD